MPDTKAATLGQRLQQALKARGMGINELDRAIGKHGYCSRIARDEREATADNLGAIALALGISLDWLVLGQGEMDSASVTTKESGEAVVDRYPFRALVARFARAAGLDPQAIEQTCAESLQSDVDPGAMYWLRQIEQRAALLALNRARSPAEAAEAERVAIEETDEMVRKASTAKKRRESRALAAQARAEKI
jgi:transcriptional regulator with XRE-family HTH domain